MCFFFLFGKVHIRELIFSLIYFGIVLVFGIFSAGGIVWYVEGEKTRQSKTKEREKEILFTNPSARAGYDTRSIFKRSLTGLNSEFSFS